MWQQMCLNIEGVKTFNFENFDSYLCISRLALNKWIMAIFRNRRYLGKNWELSLAFCGKIQGYGEKYVASLLHGYDVSERRVYRYTFRIPETRGTTDKNPGSGGHNLKITYLKEVEVLKVLLLQHRS